MWRSRRNQSIIILGNNMEPFRGIPMRDGYMLLLTRFVVATRVHPSRKKKNRGRTWNIPGLMYPGLCSMTMGRDGNWHCKLSVNGVCSTMGTDRKYSASHKRCVSTPFPSGQIQNWLSARRLRLAAGLMCGSHSRCFMSFKISWQGCRFRGFVPIPNWKTCLGWRTP